MNQIEDIVSSSENISRYILEKNAYAKSESRVKPKAFMPAPNMRTSVYRTSGLNDNEIWEIGQCNVADVRGKSLYARGDIISSDIFNLGLKVVPDVTPHHLHANITGWPEAKPERKLIALKLAEKAQLHLNPVHHDLS